MQFKESEESLQQIAKKLSVNNLIYSSVRGTEDNLSIELQLVEAFPEDRVIWSSTFILPWKDLATRYLYTELGMHFEAIEAHKKGLAISPGFETGLGVAYAKAGQRENALKVAAEMEKNFDKWYAWGLTEVYAALGDKDKAIYYLEEAYRLRQDFIPWIRYNYNLKILYDDPRFRDIVNRLNLPE